MTGQRENTGGNAGSRGWAVALGPSSVAGHDCWWVRHSKVGREVPRRLPEPDDPTPVLRAGGAYILPAMTSNRWVGDFHWQYGLSFRESYLHELVGKFDPDLAAEVYARLAPPGGVATRLDPTGLVIVSSGQDAVDSIEDAAALAADIAESLDRSVRITWTERPPLGDAGRAEKIDGYWIPAQHVAGYRGRQQEAFEALARTNTDLDRWALEEHDGFVVAAAHRGEEVSTFLLGVGQLEMIEEAAADGTLKDYAR